MSRDISQGVDPSMQFLSGGFRGNGVDSTLSRMLGNDVQQKAQFCAECGERTDVGYKNPNLKDATEVYCKTHYEQLFASKCEGCNQPIMGTYVNANGKKYHQQCHSQDISCAGCSQRLFGEVVGACNKNWHPKCFKCNTCYAPLDTSSFKERSGFPLCNKCAAIPPSGILKSTTTSTITRTASPAEVEGKKEFYGNVQKGKLFCAECGQVITTLDAVSLGPSTFHEYCFVCTSCKEPLAGSQFKNVNGKPVCVSCSGSSTGGTGGFCGGCGVKLSGTFVNAMGQKWHKDCFVCTGCRSPFTGGYAEKDGQPYCGPCIQKNQKPASSTTQIVGERKQGFTVDPRTGQKKYT